MAWDVSLAGVSLNNTSFTWELSYGAQPYSTAILMDKHRAEEIYTRGKPEWVNVGIRQSGSTFTRNPPDDAGGVSLIFQDSKDRIEIKNLHAIKVLPGDTFDTRTVLVADRRWAFRYQWVARGYNLRRGGVKRRLVAGNLTTPVQLRPEVADYVYRRSTLNKGRVWTAKEILEDVLRELVGEGNFVLGDLRLEDDVEDLTINCSGDQALETVLDFLPGVQIYQALDGKIHVGHVFDQTELDVMAKVPVLGGQWIKVDNSALQSKEFHVHFDREVELRFDYTEGGGTQERGKKGEELLLVENVIINPLYELVLPDGTTSTHGEAIPVDTFLSAVNARTDKPTFYQDITQQDLRDAWLGRWSALLHRTAFDGDTKTFVNNWVLILAALRNHWRQTFRILPQWRDKILTLAARRTAIMDYENGVRAPASVHTEYIAKLSILGLIPQGSQALAITNDDYAEDISEKNISPFKVTVVNSDQGIFRVEGVVDQTGLTESYVLGSPAQPLPIAVPGNRQEFWAEQKLSDTFKMAVIMTAVQDSPNSIERYHRQRVTIETAAQTLLIDPPENPSAPIMETFSTVRTARHAWVDNWSKQIRDAFYKGRPYPNDLTLTNEDELEGLAEAIAARELARVVDHGVGTVTGPPQPVNPTGNLQKVSYSVTPTDPGCVVTTTYTMPEDGPAVSIFPYLPEGVRRQIRGLVTDD